MRTDKFKDEQRQLQLQTSCQFSFKIALTFQNLHPPITTNASIASDARTSMVSKEASLIMPSASTPRGTVVDSII
jgi:hypothetical protein